MQDSNAEPFVNWFRHTSPYINAHRGRTFVIHLDGEALRCDGLHELIADLALLNSLGVRLVITFGARPQMQQELQRRGLDWHEHQGRLLVDAERLEALTACIGTLRIELEARLSMGLANSPMHGAGLRVMSGNLITARPLGIRDGVDMHFSGEVRRIQVKSIQALLDQGSMVLLPPLGYSATGEAFDLDAEEVATAAAIHLGAEKLLLLGDEEGLKDESGRLIRDLTPRDAELLLPQLQQQPTLQRHLQAACQACRRGVARAHLLSYRRNGALLQDLFTREGDGTMITQQRYETLRQARIEDVAGLLALLRPLEETGVLVRRSRELLEAEIERFTVIDLDGAIIGCAALYPYPDQRQAELACVVVDPDYRHGQRGDQLLDSIQKQAQAAGIHQLFVLTTHTAHWFLERGFVPARVEHLPAARQALYNWQRNSRVFCKNI
ncbi:amino-acid N-acetyltransferase [Marinospirillum alkaliphilum]|uniref:Amino-acid acetyltransferase n=1 Tax=Marinospirillum alkaliphilum DSM 21637 TaxID=1122209 RepID=A0A1K1V8G4_9GAMM|nr:amino-acid N-acetyltransferase [Marinospirillum alkaliphilum]SFX20853.1 N-acetylglutamate synthase [Marinospirillum alkaliphilum DSM 21637]